MSNQLDFGDSSTIEPVSLDIDNLSNEEDYIDSS